MESIENLDQVHLTRFPVWLHESRYVRRTLALYDTFGYGCFCARCNAGDMAAETTMFGLRCPRWAKHFPRTDNEQVCNGIVKGLRRTDYSDGSVNRLTGQSDADTDEPRPLPLCVTHAPHERAACQQCDAKYDADTMRTKILPFLKLFEAMRSILHDYSPVLPGESVHDEWVSKIMQAEQYVHPENGVYLQAKEVLLTHIMVRALFGYFDARDAQWLKKYAREVLARVAAVGCQQYDFRDLQLKISVYGHYANLNRISPHGVTQIDAETRDLLIRTAKRATEKVKLLLQMRRT